jgi:hypothetical protein
MHISVYSPQDVSQALGLDKVGATFTLGRLVATKLAEKVESGKYRSAR